MVPDGVLFGTGSIKLKNAQLNAEYKGISATFSAQLFTAKLPMQIDFGFSDTILPQPATVKYPTLLDLPAPELKGYTPETSIAEKFESIIRLGVANTRMKDFYDIWLLTQQFDFDRQALHTIIRQVLQNRGTTANTIPAAFLEPYYGNSIKQDKWNAFLRDIAHDPIPLEKVMSDLRNYFKDLIVT